LVKGNSRLPAPPPMIMESVLSVVVFRFIAWLWLVWWSSNPFYFLANRVLFALRLRGSIDYIRLPGKSCAKHPSPSSNQNQFRTASQAENAKS
jgi:hypothetical protein